MIGLISTTDRLHEISRQVFELIKSNDLKNIYFPSSAFLEYELVLKSQNIADNDILKDIIHFQNIENVKEIPLDSSIIISASKLREEHGLTYFNSLHCACALQTDQKMISTDKAIMNLEILEVIDPKSLI